MTNQLEALATAWAAAEEEGDRAALDRLLTDDFIGIGPVGFVVGKPAWLTRFSQGLHYEHLHIDEVSARRRGDAAVIIGRQRAKGEAQGNAVPEDTCVSLLATKGAAGEADWRIAGIRYSCIAPVPE